MHCETPLSRWVTQECPAGTHQLWQNNKEGRCVRSGLGSSGAFLSPKSQSQARVAGRIRARVEGMW